MKRMILVIAGVVALSGCTTFNSVPVPPDRHVASDDQYLNLAFNRYFANQNFFTRLVRIESLAQQLIAAMPEKGSAKKRLVQQFTRDLHQVTAALVNDKISADSKYYAWAPSTQEAGFNEKVRLLGKVVQSSRIMDRMGIYLTASGIFEDDTYGENFYFNLIARALYEIDSEMNKLVLVYPPEMKESDENEAKINYAKSLAGEIRLNLHKIMPRVNSPDYKKMDSFLQKLASMNAADTGTILKLSSSSDFKFAQSILSQVQLTNSGDILGFEDQVETTIATKFSFEMIHQLVTSVR